MIDFINGYALLAEKLFNKPLEYSGAWNLGPNKSSNKNVITLVTTLNQKLDEKTKIFFKKGNFHEEKSIGLDSNKSKKKLNWKPQFSFFKCIKLTANIYNQYYKKKLKYESFQNQINHIKN